jgi:quercetin dioxygenase-like cupin family protein
LEIQPKLPTTKGPSETFVGDVWLDMIAEGDLPSRIRVAIVRFAPGARNAWHRHANGQTLHVTEGRGLVQARGADVTEIGAGDTIYTPPGGVALARCSPRSFHDTHLHHRRPQRGSARAGNRVGRPHP